MDFYNSYIFLKPNRNEEESFYFFIKNSEIKLLSDSSAFSFVYKCSFKLNSSFSPYYYINSYKYQKSVTEIVIKCLLLNDRNDNTSDDDHYWYYKRMCGKESKRSFDIKSRFEEEIEIQSKLSKKSLYTLNRNVPIVFYSTVFEKCTNKFQKLKSILSYENNPIKQMFEELEKRNADFYKPTLFEMLNCFKSKKNDKKNENNDNDNNYYFGIIAMEYITPNYKTFCDIIKPIIMNEIISKSENKDIYKHDSLTLSTKSNRLRWIYNIARYEIIRLAIDTGYSQGDYHTDNILIDEDTRRCIIIDFGKAKIIPDIINIFENINEDVSNINKFLNKIFYTTFDDDKKYDEFMWLKNIDEIDVDIILFLHENRLTYIENQSYDIFTSFLI